ncbi:N-acetylglucosamine-6-phosphate deacetylase [Sulfobacillus sp. hq2]|uniref:N-acetylglucosamine-6-phosphate deacetylase n=1 Tax=Sulfobacillus TaxID=28033 RepID=UPI001304A217|nr:N-acetylglucosamine-6-phosphate deacetylase [Sulfobacillus sp. hq2]
MNQAIEGRVYISTVGQLVPARIEWNVQGRITRLTRLDTRSTALPVVLPGFIDEHIHGACGHDVMEAHAEAWEQIEHALSRHGVTAFLATTITAPWDDLMAVADLARQWTPSPLSTCIGMHWEGPYLDRQYKGAQPLEAIRAVNLEEIERAIVPLRHAERPLRVMTLAPNQSSADQAIRLLTDHGIHVNMGHSGAGRSQAWEGMLAGADAITHLFNAMAPLHHREPGLLGLGLSAENLWLELITDGIHVHPDIVRMVFQLAAHRIILITDGISAIDQTPGRYRLGQWMVHVDGVSARLDDGTLAGSILTPDQSLRNLLQWGVPLREVVQAWCEAPARRLALGGRGRIEEGAWADLAIFDAQYQVLSTIKNGHVLYQR